MSILDTLKNSYSLEEAAKRLSKTFGEEVSIKNVLEFCITDECSSPDTCKGIDGCENPGTCKLLPLSVILRNAFVVERFDYCPLPNSFRYIYESACDLDDINCLNRIGKHAIDMAETLSGLSEKEYERVRAYALTPASVDILPNLPEQTRVKKIMEQASSLWVQYKDLGFLSESRYPEVIYSCEEDPKAIYFEPDYEATQVLDGDYLLDMTENLGRLIRDELVIGASLIIENDDMRDFMVFGDDGGKYTPVGYISEDERRTEPFLSPYYLLEGLPPIETLIIQTKHLAEFESKHIKKKLPKTLNQKNKTPSKPKQRKTALEKLIKEKGEQYLKTLGRLGIWMLLHHRDNALFPPRDIADSTVNKFFSRAKLITIYKR